MLEISADAVSLRVAAGVVGLILGICYLAMRDRWPARALPPGFTGVVGITLFGTATAALVVLSAGRHTDLGGLTGGPGSYLSGAIVSLAAAAAFLPSLRRALISHWLADPHPPLSRR
jgi:hypothetical protein